MESKKQKTPPPARKQNETSQEGAPAGYKILKEGQARILYKEERLEADENNMIKT